MLVRLAEHIARRHTVWILAAHAAVIVWLAAPLPAHVWFVGDPGIKWFAAQDAIAHPARPLESQPGAGASNAADYPQPFFVPHDDHAHAMTSPVFPLLSAPFIALFGIRGAYVLPAIGWLLIAPLTVAVSRRLGARASPMALWITSLIATPFVFYGLEFWEHAPAVAASLGCAALAFGTPTGAGVRQASPARLIAAGLVGGVAILLRPEAAFTILAIGVAVVIITLPKRDVRHPIPIVLAGAAVVAAPLVIYNLAHFGSLLQPHLSGNLGGDTESRLVSSVEAAWLWLGIHRGWTQVAMALMLATIVLARLGGRRPWTMTPGLLGLVALAVELGRGHDLRETLWRVFPLALLVLVPAGRSTAARRALWCLIAIPIAAAVVFAPNDGGGQWGPRYLLATVPPLLILALDTTTTLASAVGRRVAWVVVAAVIGASTAAAVDAYVTLRDAKRHYAGIVDRTAREVGVGVMLTDVWWLPQMSAATVPRDRMMWVESAGRGRDWLATRSIRDVLLVTGPELDVASWTRDTCLQPNGPSLAAAELRYTRLTCR